MGEEEKWHQVLLGDVKSELQLEVATSAKAEDVAELRAEVAALKVLLLQVADSCRANA